MNIKEKIEKWIKETLKVEEVVLVHPKEVKNGDYTLIINSSNTEQEFGKLKENLIPEIEKIEIANQRFINFFLSKNFFVESVEGIIKDPENFGKSESLKGEKIFFEHTQPNPFKELHIGHLMNNTIGESVARTLKANNAEVKTCSYHGDVGLHVAKAIWGKLRNPELAWGKAYAFGSSEYETNKEEIIEMNKKVYERSDENINKLYDEGKKDSLDQFEEIYEELDSHFDFHFYESESGEMGKKLVLENVGKVFVEGEGGAIIFKGEEFEPKTHTRVFLNSEKLPTYEAKEVGLAEIKKEKFNYDISITVTGNEQDSFFKVVEVAIGEVFPDRKGKLKHLSHGMLNLPSGKMSSRTGNIITAESLIEQVKEKVFEKLKDRDLSESEKEEVAEMVAIGAIKYSILRQAVGGDIIFDFDKSLSFEGDSGPYLQYTYVRAESVLEKALKVDLKDQGFNQDSWQTTDLERILYRFGEVVKRAAEDYSPHHLVTYLTELAGEFNSFYAKNKIIEESENSPYKLALTQSVATVLKNGLNLLGIKVPKKM